MQINHSDGIVQAKLRGRSGSTAFEPSVAMPTRIFRDATKRIAGMDDLRSMKKSVIAFAVAFVLALVSMGALGACLYYPAMPVLGPLFGSLDDWEGDWVWPATIIAGMLWSVSFLLAGWMDVALRQRDIARSLRRAVYVATLWLGDVAVWMLVLATMT